MGLFGTQAPKNTIHDKKWADLQRRARKEANKESMFSKRNVARRLASNTQQERRWLS